MRRRRKNPHGKLAAAAVLALAALAALLVLLPARMPAPPTGDGPDLVPVGAFAGRKNIYDRRLRELAVSLRLTSVYARPLELRDSEMTAGELATILEREEKELLSALKSERSFVWLGRRLDTDKAERIAALGAKGLYFFEEEQRYYPQHETAAHVLGFLSNDQGLAGIEFQYDQILQGGSGERVLPPDQQAAPELAGEKGGAHLVLTLDLDLQALVERELAKARQETGAASAMGLVMERGSGEIHALANLPAFDPNRFWDSTSAARRNRVLADEIHPGGLERLFLIAAGGPESAAGHDGGEAPLLAPSRRKAAQGTTGSLHPEWVELEEGLYASPALAGLSGPAADALPDRFLAAGERGIDLPTEPGATTPGGDADHKDQAGTLSALQLVTGFNRLVSAAGTGPPHLLKAVWPAGKEPVAVDYETRPPAAGPTADSAVLAILEQGGGMAESLVDKRRLAAVGAGKDEERCHHQDLLLGVSGGDRTFTFLLALDGACIDPSRASLLRQAGRRLLKRLANPAPKAARPAAPGDSKPEKLYQQWQQVHGPAVHDGGHPVLRPADRMPDLKGHALRQALQELQPYGIPVEVTGSGRVTGQTPKAGAPLAGVGQIRLELRAE